AATASRTKETARLPDENRPAPVQPHPEAVIFAAESQTETTRGRKASRSAMPASAVPERRPECIPRGFPYGQSDSGPAHRRSAQCIGNTAAPSGPERFVTQEV